MAREYWSVDPFAGTIKDGYLYGRGTLDMKGSGVAQLMAMIAIKRSGIPLNRDIVRAGMTSSVGDNSRMKRELLSALAYPTLREGIRLL